MERLYNVFLYYRWLVQVKYHETELRLDGEGGWQQRRLPAA